MKSEININNPETFFLKLNKEKNVCFLNSYSKDGWKKIIAFNPKYKFTSNKVNPKKFEKFTNENKNRLLIGYISYEYGVELHKIKIKTKNDLKLPKINFYAYENYLLFKKNKAFIVSKNNNFIKKINEINKRTDQKSINQKKSKNFKPEISAKEYLNAYKKIKKHIKNGDFYQINLTHRLKAKSHIPSKLLFKLIIEKNPVGFLGYIEGKNFEILSASPERFIKIENNKITTSPIKGTRRRYKKISKDKESKKNLLESEKEASELNMITDLLRNDLGKISKIGSVKVEANRKIKKCPTVWHTYSKISGIISKKTTPVKALLSLLPGGSISGCPKKRALEIINELETNQRSVYTGIIGYIENKTNMDFNIAIRTVIKKEKDLYLSVGGGIVHDSDSKSEFKETFEKAKSFMEIL